MSLYTSAASWSVLTHLSLITSMLLRNIIFARFLSPEEFAVALTFGVALSFFEYISNFGHENLMQRSPHGDQQDFQATMHSMMIARGIVVAGIVLVSAPWIAIFLNTENTSFNYAWLAIVPLVNGFAHLDHQRLHRQQNYIVTAKIGLVSDALSVIVALLSIAVFDSYWAFFVSFLFRHSISTYLSHSLAERHYQLAWEATHIRALLQFGVPLLGVGLLKYFGLELDKAVIANVAGLEVFAIYALNLLVLVNGCNLVTVALSKIFVRRVSTAGGAIAEVVASNGIVFCFLVFPILIALCGLGENVIQWVFGHQYSRIPFLIVFIGALVGLRSLNQWLNQTVIASAPTGLMLRADLMRMVTVLMSLWALYAYLNSAAEPIFNNRSAVLIVGVFWIGEVVYLLTLSRLVNRRFEVARSVVKATAIYAVVMCLISAIYLLSYESSLQFKVVCVTISVVLYVTVFILFSQHCRFQLLSLIETVRSRASALFFGA